ncbi:Uncharacterised protein [Mycobacterium tuberculosis]|uniref:Uncharacterized protein n=4 Tax=Mycobacterium tuberculosis TaxID=1773 RepID=A0A655A8V8_MYCTX|nr:Uncharacterised protein [Mycobacterium tuberculosis]
MQPTHRQPGRRRHRVLLGDPDVEQSIREALPERGQPGGARHGRGNGHDVTAFLGVADKCIREGRRPAWAGHLGGLSGGRIDRDRGMHLLGLVGLGRRVAHALAGDDVHDHRCTEAPRAAQRDLHRPLVMAVDRADVLQPEVGEQQLRRQRVLDAGLDAVQESKPQTADKRHRAHQVAARLQRLLVGRLQPQRGQMVGDAPDCGRVAAPIVVDHDNHRPAGCGDIVQRLPAHTAGERTVTDHRDHMPVAVSGQLERLGQPVRVRQRRAGVARLHPVVLALGTRRIPRQPALLTQGCEVLAASGQHLVDVGLVTGVEDDRIVRRVEYPVQRQGEFHHSQVRPQMPPRGGNLVDQELTDLGGQLPKLRLGKVLQISGPADLLQHFASVRSNPPIGPACGRRSKGPNHFDSVGGRRAGKPGRRLIVIQLRSSI